MTPLYSEHGQTILCGDCLRILPTFDAERFSTVITDPPYGLGFMGKTWDRGVPGVPFWEEIMRVCKPGAFLLAFGGTRTFHRLTCAIEDAGWEIKDCVLWLYGQGFPKSLNIGKSIDKAAGAEREILGKRTDGRYANGFSEAAKRATGNAWKENQGFVGEMGVITAPATDLAREFDGWETALKPAWEPIIVAMKPLDGTFAQNAQRHGVAGMNIDGGRIGFDRPAMAKVSNGTPREFLRSEGRAVVGTQSGGRWPANVLLDEEAAALLDEQSGVLTSNSGTLTHKNGVQRNAFGKYGACASAGISDSGGASRFFYTAKASKSDRGAGNDHPTVKPIALMKYLCTLTATPTGGEILDPFGGSMTTLVAARECGRLATAIELDEKNCRIGIKRLGQGVLFGAA